MKLSAKITTVTFLAAMALGAATLTGGCTVTSTSNTDTDGGTSSSSGGSSGGSSGSTTTDGGGDGGGETCAAASKMTNKYPAACQSCTEAKCCDKIDSCFGQAAPDGGVDCNGYAECVSTCEEGSDPNCIDDQCKAAAPQSIITAFDILEQCQVTNCNTECFE